MVQITGLPPVEAAPLGTDIFVTEPLGSEITFERNANGKAIALTLNQRGSVFRAARR